MAQLSVLAKSLYSIYIYIYIVRLFRGKFSQGIKLCAQLRYGNIFYLYNIMCMAIPYRIAKCTCELTNILAIGWNRENLIPTNNAGSTVHVVHRHPCTHTVGIVLEVLWSLSCICKDITMHMHTPHVPCICSLLHRDRQ